VLLLKTLGLFILTALAEIVGCYLPSLGWLWKVDRVPLTRWDVFGASVALAGMTIIVWGGWRS
jgi:drug/metabolite transporter superfamily protein YnfA